MFLYPALLAGFFFVAVPLLVHLINMLRHRRQQWAAMDFLLASYRKQKKWIRLRQLLLLLSRLAVAALLIAMLCGWTGGGGLLGMLGGQTTHHVVILDDSYSMGDNSGGMTAYKRSLQMLETLTRRLASDEGNHQLTVMRASRAAMLVKAGSESGDAAADLSAQTISTDARLISRLMSTTSSPIRTDLVPALDLAGKLIASTPADAKYLYIASDFRQRDWGMPDRLSQSLRGLSDEDIEIRMVDCAVQPTPNLGITDLTPVNDVWVAGVPVVVSVTVRNYGTETAADVSLSSRVIRYSDALQNADPTSAFSGQIDSLPPLVIESIDPGKEVTKTFQVYVTDIGTHGVEVSLPDDPLAIDNRRVCTIPLSDVGKVLIIDSDPDELGAYHVASVLNPGSQVRIGAVPEIKPPSFLRSATIETLAPYRAIFLIDLPQIGENASDALAKFVYNGGGLGWFLGSEVRATSYNDTLLVRDRNLLPGPLMPVKELEVGSDGAGDLSFAQSETFIDPLRSSGDAYWGRVGVAQSWTLKETEVDPEAKDEELTRPRVRVALKRRDGLPFATEHQVGRGRVITTLCGLDDRWTNWRTVPSFVTYLLLANAKLWSGSAPTTQRWIDEPIQKSLASEVYVPEVTFVPPSLAPPRVPVDLLASPSNDGDQPEFSGSSVNQINLDPTEMIVAGEGSVDEVLRPGLSELVLTKNDGRTQVLPVASVIRVGEGDLQRADSAAIQQGLLPLEVKFASSSVWNEENRTAGSSTLTLFLLGLLALVLAAEQLLAYWASYHVSSAAGKA